MRAIGTLMLSLLICCCLPPLPRARKSRSASASMSRRRHCRFTTSRQFRRPVTSGRPAIGPGMTTPAITGCRARGYCRRSRRCCGRRIWGWNDGVYAFHEGYWGPKVGFYGGVSYGYGYGGVGYEGGYWRGGAFFYNRSVNNFSNVQITNVYNKTVVVNNTTNVSYNGGTGGTTAHATPQQIAAANQQHVPPTSQRTPDTCKWRRKIRRCRSTTITAIRPLRRPATQRN